MTEVPVQKEPWVRRTGRKFYTGLTDSLLGKQSWDPDLAITITLIAKKRSTTRI